MVFETTITIEKMVKINQCLDMYNELISTREKTNRDS